MTPLRISITLIAGLFCADISSAVDVQLAGAARDPGVERWIWYQILGPRNHPLPIVYFSTLSFKTMLDERLIVLAPSRYEIVSAYTQARLSQTDCPGEMPRGDVWYSVEIASHSEKQGRRCVLPQASACDYLNGLLRLSGVEWTATERRPIVDFMAEVTCDAGSATGQN